MATTAAFLFLVLGVISLFSIFGLTRSFLNGFSAYLGELFGWGVLIFPFLCVLSGLYFWGITWRWTTPRFLASLALFLASALSLTALISPEAGGRLGVFFSKTLTGPFTPLGAFLILACLVAASLLLAANIPFKEALNKFALQIRQFLNWSRREVFGTWAELLRRRREQRAEKEVEIVRDAEEEEGEEEKEKTAKPKIKITGWSREVERAPKEAVVEVLKEERGETVRKVEPAGLEPVSKQMQSGWNYPPLDLLSDAYESAAERGDIEQNAEVITQTLGSFGIQAKVAEVNLGPAVTQYALELAEGTKISQITSLQNDLALALAAPTGTVRIEAPIPGRSLVGVEVPNYSASLVSLKSVLSSEAMKLMKSKLAVPLGYNVAGETVVADIAQWPHVLIAGATGSGKSVLLHSVISTLLFRNAPYEIRLILVDPKRVELTQYEGVPHLLTPVIVEVEKVISALKWAIAEMERRYQKLQEAGARDLFSYNQANPNSKLPYILIIVDELADVMAFAANEVEKLVCRIAQMSRAVGIHLVLSTQRPSVDVLTGLIKANIPTRIALNVTSGTDSRVIIDTVGAEKLLGRGDMLYLPPNLAKPIRIQGVFVSLEEIKKLLEFIREQSMAFSQPQLAEGRLTEPMVEFKEPAAEEPEDPLFSEALRVIINHDRASASLLQRRLSIGYARAARLLDELEERGLVGPKDGSKPREVYGVKIRQYLEKLTRP